MLMLLFCLLLLFFYQIATWILDTIKQFQINFTPFLYLLFQMDGDNGEL